MDNARILLVNLSHGRLGEDAASLLGALLVTSIEQAAKSRADIAEHERKDFMVYADEFQAYATAESLAVIVSQARKFRLSLCLATQIIESMSHELAAMVLGNVGNLCVMQLAHGDSERMARELGQQVTPGDLIALPKFHAVVRLLIDGEPTRPFTIRTLPPPSVAARHAAPDRLMRVSANRFTPVAA